MGYRSRTALPRATANTMKYIPRKTSVLGSPAPHKFLPDSSSQPSVHGEMQKQGADAGDKSFVSSGGISLWKCPRVGRGSLSVLTLELKDWLWWDVRMKGYRDGGIWG